MKNVNISPKDILSTDVQACKDPWFSMLGFIGRPDYRKSETSPTVKRPTRGIVINKAKRRLSADPKASPPFRALPITAFPFPPTSLNHSPYCHRSPTFNFQLAYFHLQASRRCSILWRSYRCSWFGAHANPATPARFACLDHPIHPAVISSFCTSLLGKILPSVTGHLCNA